MKGCAQQSLQTCQNGTRVYSASAGTWTPASAVFLSIVDQKRTSEGLSLLVSPFCNPSVTMQGAVKGTSKPAAPKAQAAGSCNSM